MISRAFALDQVRRFDKLNFFPKDDDRFVAELVEAMAESRTEDVAKAVVMAWLRESDERPTPADLYRLVGYHNAAASARERASLPDCPRCNGVGQWIGSRLYRGEWVSVAGTCEACGGSGKLREKATV